MPTSGSVMRDFMSWNTGAFLSLTIAYIFISRDCPSLIALDRL